MSHTLSNCHTVHITLPKPTANSYNREKGGSVSKQLGVLCPVNHYSYIGAWGTKKFNWQREIESEKMSERMRERQRKTGERKTKKDRWRKRQADGERDRQMGGGGERERNRDHLQCNLFLCSLWNKNKKLLLPLHISHTHKMYAHTQCPRACTHNFLLWSNGSQFSSRGDASALGGLSNLRLQTFQLGLKADSATGQPQRSSSHITLYSSYTLLPISLLSIRKQSRIQPHDDITLADLPQLAAVARRVG